MKNSSLLALLTGNEGFTSKFKLLMKPIEQNRNSLQIQSHARVSSRERCKKMSAREYAKNVYAMHIASSKATLSNSNKAPSALSA